MAIDGKHSSLGRLLQYTMKSALRAWMAIYLNNVRMIREMTSDLETRAHGGDRFVLGYLESTPQVSISNGSKPVRPTKVLDDKSPCWAKFVAILKGLLLCS